MRSLSYDDEAQACRRVAQQFGGKPEATFLLRVASSFEELAVRQCKPCHSATDLKAGHRGSRGLQGREVIALSVITLLWVGSALLVIPYLLRVAKAQVEQAACLSPEPGLLAQQESSFSHKDDFVGVLLPEAEAVPLIPDTPTVLGLEPKDPVEA